MEKTLVEVKEWAEKKIASGAEPPWAWYQYMKLIETVDAILTANYITTTESSPQLAERQGVHLRLADSTCPQDSAQLHPVGMPVRMPM